MADNLRAAAEMVARINRGEWKPGMPPTSQDHWDAVLLLADWAVQHLTSPLPADVEAELQRIALALSEAFRHGDRSAPHIANLFRPLLARAAGREDYEEKVRQLESLLTEVEWVQPTSNASPSCPFCGNQQHWGHAKGCEFVAALGVPLKEDRT